MDLLASVCLLWRNVYLGLPLIFGLGFFFFFDIYLLVYLEINPFSDAWLQIFSPILRVVFLSYLCFPFAVQKLLNLIRSHLFILFNCFLIQFSYSTSWKMRCHLTVMTTFLTFFRYNYLATQIDTPRVLPRYDCCKKNMDFFPPMGGF